MSVDVMMGKAFLEYEAYRACVTREGLTCGAMLDSIAEMQCNTLCARHGRGGARALESRTWICSVSRERLRFDA